MARIIIYFITYVKKYKISNQFYIFRLLLIRTFTFMNGFKMQVFFKIEKLLILLSEDN